MRFASTCIAVVLSSSAALAEEEVRFRVDYDAPSGCPAARDFTAGVTGRTERARIARSADTVVVEVRVASGALIEGRIHIRGVDREAIERTVRAASCAEVVDALALITALAFDPDASAEARPREAEPDLPPPNPPPGPTPPSPRPSSQAELEWAFGLGIGLIPFDSALPGNDVGLAAFVAASSEGKTLAPEVLVIATRRTGSASQAKFSLTTLTLAGCPLRFPATGALAARPCAGFELGALSAEGVGLAIERRPTRLWLAPMLLGRGEWRFAAPFAAHVGVGLSVPLTRQHYFFDSGERVHDIPAVSAGMELGLGVGFL
jgi:hypothetical protein